MLFTSDNWGGVHPQVMEAICSVNGGSSPAYGNDDVTDRVVSLFSEVFEREVAVAFVPTGSAANGIALGLLTPPYGAVMCHEHAHVLIDECGAPEFYTGGAKVIPSGGALGKMDPLTLRIAMKPYDPPLTHRVRPSVLSLTQATEWGTVYAPDEVAALVEAAKGFGMAAHMDGARFAGAVAATDASPAELTWKAGIDVLSLGGTKNGCLSAEAVVVFDPSRKEELDYRCKRAGLGTSKQRFFSAQWLAYFADDLWLALARAAHARCAGLAEGFEATPGVSVLAPPMINELFVRVPHDKAQMLRDAGAQFYDWIQPGDPYDGEMRRFVTSWETSANEIEELVTALEHLA